MFDEHTKPNSIKVLYLTTHGVNNKKKQTKLRNAYVKFLYNLT